MFPKTRANPPSRQNRISISSKEDGPRLNRVQPALNTKRRDGIEWSKVESNSRRVRGQGFAGDRDVEASV